ncbi:MAG: hypothetical protein JO108_31425 [Acidobacteriaceae bacterium]|nr:hypothetical protein [Acidobacteriaceae bacterium]
MRLRILSFCWAITLLCARLGAAPAESVYAPLALYAGTWTITKSAAPAGTMPDTLKNICARVGSFYACQQTVNNQPGNMMIFIPTNNPGHYYTQNVTLEGRATSRGDLEINGDRWVYSSTWDAGGHTVHYRTTNVFSGRNHIHFEQSESTNGKDWTTTASGDEQRVAGTSH